MNTRKFITKVYIRVLRSGEPITWNFISKISMWNIDTGNFDEEEDPDDLLWLTPEEKEGYIVEREKNKSKIVLNTAEKIASHYYDTATKNLAPNFNNWNCIERDTAIAIANDLESTLDNKNDEDHHNLELICDIFKPTDIERRALNIGLYLRHKTSSGKTIALHFDNILPGFNATQFEVQRMAFGFTFSEIEDMKNSQLFNSGVLVPHSSDEYFAIEPSLGDIFQIQNLSVDYLKEKLFKTSIQESTLSEDSFSHLSKEVRVMESILKGALIGKSKGTNIFLWGEPGTGKTELPYVLGRKNGWQIISVGDVSSQNAKEKTRAERLSNLRLAQAIFSSSENAIILFDEFEDVANMEIKNSKAFINRLLETTEVPIIWTTNNIYNVDKASLRRMTYNIEFKLPNSDIRKKIWKLYDEKYKVGLEDSYIEKIAEEHEMSPSLIHNAMKIASSPEIDRDDIVHIIESLNKLVNYGENPSKTNYNKHVGDLYSTEYVNADIDVGVLTNQIVAAKGNFSLCLFGAPGTGKSEYGKYLAHKLGKKLLYKRVSDLGSMYVDESEKKIAAAFHEASETDKILMIDEGDSFLRDRNEAKNSWEVTRVNEMLSQMEMLSCTFILSTNLMEGIDKAALRRFTFKIGFDYLKEEQSVAIFKKYFEMEPPASLKTLENLTPGDFKVVRDKAKILDITNASELFAMLKGESELKEPKKPNKIGF